MNRDGERRVILLSPEDNCVIACQTLEPGTVVCIDGEAVRLTQRVELGHKLARCALRQGELVLRYGAEIGSASQDIARGEHIHLHNLVSHYLPTRARGENLSAASASGGMVQGGDS